MAECGLAIRFQPSISSIATMCASVGTKRRWHPPAHLEPDARRLPAEARQQDHAPDRADRLRPFPSRRGRSWRPGAAFRPVAASRLDQCPTSDSGCRPSFSTNPSYSPLGGLRICVVGMRPAGMAHCCPSCSNAILACAPARPNCPMSFAQCRRSLTSRGRFALKHPVISSWVSSIAYINEVSPLGDIRLPAPHAAPSDCATAPARPLRAPWPHADAPP